jgi:hypothetical protein
VADSVEQQFWKAVDDALRVSGEIQHLIGKPSDPPPVTAKLDELRATREEVERLGERRRTSRRARPCDTSGEKNAAGL